MRQKMTLIQINTDKATRERRISIQLRNLNEKLKINVTFLLQIPEVKEDKLKTAVKLDLLTKLSVSLQDMYIETLAMVAEACKCDEDLKREFYDFAYHGLRAEHNDLLPRVKDLESLQAEMSDEEKKDFERLKQIQINRQRQVDRLETLWRGLFTLVHPIYFHFVTRDRMKLTFPGGLIGKWEGRMFLGFRTASKTKPSPNVRVLCCIYFK